MTRQTKQTKQAKQAKQGMQAIRTRPAREPKTPQAAPARSFRITTAPGQAALVEALLAAQGFAFEAEPFLESARRLTHEPFPLGSSLAASFGLIYIQDRSSMLPSALLGARPGELCLDMCASPGGKTGILALAVGPEGFVLAAEASRERLATLRQNLRRMNAANVATAGGEAQHLPLKPGSLDCILLDPPCSGWGTADKNPLVLTLWTPEKAETLVRLQRVLLARAATLLKPGGTLMYSTCTTHVRENEEQAAWALDTLPLALSPLPAPAGFCPREPALPGLGGVLRVGGTKSDHGAENTQAHSAETDNGGQGFFLARFVKQADMAAGGGDDEENGREEARDLGGRVLPARDLAAAGPLAPGNLPPGEVRDFGGKVYFLHRHALELLGQSPGLRWQGLPLGSASAGRFRPDPRARLLLPPADQLDPAQRLDVDEPKAILDLLSGRSLDLPGTGNLVGLYFRGLPLGLLTRKGRRLLWSDR
jgi:16S rRNA (cytosine1407-C5)-methyltransferase